METLREREFGWFDRKDFTSFSQVKFGADLMYRVRQSREMDGSTMEVGDAKLSQPYIGNYNGFTPRAFAIFEVARLHAFVSTCPSSCSFGDFCRTPMSLCLFIRSQIIAQARLGISQRMTCMGCRSRLYWFGMGISSSEHRRSWRKEVQELRRRRRQRRSCRRLRNWTASARAGIV
jgi:hypothetical protein